MRTEFSRVSALAVILALIAAAHAAPLPDDEALRKEAVRLNDVIGEDKIEEQIKLLRKDPERTKKVLAMAVKLAKDKDQPFNYTGAFILGSAASDQKDVDAGVTFFRICLDKAEKLKSDRKKATAYTELIDLYAQNKKYEDAEKVCKELLETPGGTELNIAKVMALRRMIQVTALQGKTDEAFKQLEPYLKAAPDDPAVLEMHGWLLRYSGKYEEAAKAYEKALAEVSNEKGKDILRYSLSGLYAEIGDVDKAAGHLQELVKKEPDNATYNNDLGYIWADHDKNLDEAEKLIKKALDKEPDSSAYLDSMGWVLYKKKKFKEAKEYLLKAIKNPDGEHAEILDHLGDVHLALGEKTEAVAAWKRAVEVSGASKRDQKRKTEVEAKIKKNE